LQIFIVKKHLLRTKLQLLSRIDTVSCQQILAILVSNSQTSGSMTGQEERDNLFARLFGIKAIIQSGLLVKETPLRTSSAAPSSLQCFEAVLSELLLLAEKKSWLRESCWWTILTALDSVNSSSISWRGDAINLVLDKLYVEEKSWSPEKVALTIKLKSISPGLEWGKYISSPFKGGDILATSNLLSLGRIMKVSVVCLPSHRYPAIYVDQQESYVDETEDVSTSKHASGSWKPHLHFAWSIIMDTLLRNDVAITDTKFQDFYRVVVDGMYVRVATSSVFLTETARNTFCLFLIIREEILGFPSFPECLASVVNVTASHALHN
jgi:DNA polymerase phi